MSGDAIEVKLRPAEWTAVRSEAARLRVTLSDVVRLALGYYFSATVVRVRREDQIELEIPPLRIEYLEDFA